MAQDPKKKSGFFQVLSRTRKSLIGPLASLFSSSQPVNENELDDLHDALILSDIGFEASEKIIESVRLTAKRSSVSGEQVAALIGREVESLLGAAEKNLEIQLHVPPVVIMMVGVNGVGKTTTCAKIANYYKNKGHSVMLAACDTFRPAAIEQLQSWGERLQVPVIAQSAGADPAAVAHDALHAAVGRKCSILLADTSGRQQTRDDLMRQLGKIRRVIGKIEPTAPHETLITIDAGTGQNAISQVENFHQHTPLSGICVSKLDGTAKGGIVVSLTQKFSLPIPFIGLGEGIDDIAPFDARNFANSLIGMEAAR
ncbi:MAG: signal recognition particle-docking protein FtsY [Acidiferrobacterales bacterium]|nr:signal recognition particle-docking protein FtsY [Acidiferrobacterales bacterium]